MELLNYNMFNVPVLAWFDDDARSTSVVVKPGHAAPQAATIWTVRYMNRNVLAYHRSRQEVINPTDNDVLGGRGKHCLQHPGNIWFTRLVDQFKTDYYFGSPSRKANIVLNEILAPMDQQGRRFIKLVLQDRRRNIWRWVLDPNPRAKIGNKIRDMINNNASHDAQSRQGCSNPTVHPAFGCSSAAALVPPSQHPLVSFEEHNHLDNDLVEALAEAFAAPDHLDRCDISWRSE